MAIMCFDRHKDAIMVFEFSILSSLPWGNCCAQGVNQTDILYYPPCQLNKQACNWGCFLNKLMEVHDYLRKMIAVTQLTFFFFFLACLRKTECHAAAFR